MVVKVITVVCKMYVCITQESKVRRIAVGAGYGFREHELGKIASNYSYVLKVFGVNEMFSKLENVINLACDEQDIGKFGRR